LQSTLDRQEIHLDLQRAPSTHAGRGMFVHSSRRSNSRVTETYDDDTIVCGTDRLEIHSYYFPFGTKRVPYTQIKGLQRIEIKGLRSGKWRFWGTGNPAVLGQPRQEATEQEGWLCRRPRAQCQSHRPPRQARRVRVRAPQPSEPGSGQRTSDEGPLHLTGRSRSRNVARDASSLGKIDRVDRGRTGRPSLRPP
jgi:hypothetical protein